MKKIILMSASLALLLSSCVSQKKYAELEAMQKETKDRLNTATIKLNSCLEEKAGATAKANAKANAKAREKAKGCLASARGGENAACGGNGPCSGLATQHLA